MNFEFEKDTAGTAYDKSRPERRCAMQILPGSRGNGYRRVVLL